MIGEVVAKRVDSDDQPLDLSEVYHVPYERYPWAQWTDGKTWILTAGVDFSCSPASFKAAVHAAARRMGLVARTAAVYEDDQPDRIKVTFYKRSR